MNKDCEKPTCLVCLKIKEPLEEGFYRTDISYGTGAGKSPVEMVSERTKSELKAAGFKEISYREILDKYDWEK